MLKLKFMFENYELAKEALDNWFHDKEYLDEYLKHFRISSNAVYPFAFDEGLYYLRLTPVSEVKEEDLIGELEYITYIVESGYPANIPVKSKNGVMLEKIRNSGKPYYASVFKGVCGVCIENLPYSDSMLYCYGRSLAELHKLSEEFTPTQRKQSHENVLEWVHDILRINHAPDFMMEELNDLESALSHIEMNSSNYGLVHYDFEPDNVFYDADNNTCYVIDFNDAMYHWYALDIAQVLDSLAEVYENEFLDAKEKFLEGYRSVRPFENDDCNILGLMHRFTNLYGYARIINCLSEEIEVKPVWMEQLIAKLQAAASAREQNVLTMR